MNEIYKLRSAGVPLGHIMVIHATWRGAERMLQRLRQALGLSAVVDPRGTSGEDRARVCTLNTVAGLESPIVFLMGVRDLFEEEQSLRLSDQEREELIRHNTRKLYMAFTRAGQRLVLSYVGQLPDGLRRLLAAGQVLATEAGDEPGKGEG